MQPVQLLMVSEQVVQEELQAAHTWVVESG